MSAFRLSALLLVVLLAVAVAGFPRADDDERKEAEVAHSAGKTYGELESSCVKCHREYDDKSKAIVEEFSSSIHKEMDFSCDECHGGDPTTMDISAAKAPEKGFIGKPAKQDIPRICARCHSDAKYMRQYGNMRTDQFELYKGSAHGKALLEHGDTHAATCTDCHSAHHISRATDPKSPIYKPNQPDTCAKCHADAELMGKYGHEPSIPADYKAGEHGKLLLEKKDLGAPVCSDCHGSHGAKPPGVTTIEHVCGNCHLATEKYYNQSNHTEAFNSMGLGRCITCHNQHNNEKPTEAYFGTGDQGKCISCHAEGSEEFKQITGISKVITDIKGLHTEADGLVEKTEHTTHLSMHDMIPQVEQIQTQLITARAMQHSTNLKAMEETRVAAEGSFKTVKDFTIKLLERSRFNKMMVLLLGALLIGFGFFLVIYRRLVLDKSTPWVTYEGAPAGSEGSKG